MVKKRGANFCHVAKSRQDSQDKPAITLGSQKWKGNIPSLINSPAIRIKREAEDPMSLEANTSQVNESLYNLSLPKIRRLDPNAWATKYFTADSLLDMLFWYTNRGRNPIRLTSRPAQMPSQCVEEIENNVPILITEKNIYLKGRLENIRKRIKSNYPKQS